MATEKILITGALGQIGTELTNRLVEIHGRENVVASGLDRYDQNLTSAGYYERMDVTNTQLVRQIVKDYEITTVYHLASLLSGTSEKQPLFAWKLNVEPLINFCEMAREGLLSKIFWPSSIAVFGKGIPKENVAQDVVLNPTTVYGISKLAGEKWCEYYHDKYGVDVRSIRYPGLISYKTPPGGGTTDYAVEIFYKAIEENSYTSFITEDTFMPMLYMEDAIEATLKLMQAEKDALSVRTSYNLGGMSFSPKELAAAIEKKQPGFTISYQPDFRQAIADSWPASIDDSVARQDWGLTYKYGLEEMTEDMLKNLKEKLK
ncbi:NAD-dependent epimerase/dehydratase family protein [Planobacterium oryzisoli]|uniref:NAD-dependent epimerase/dehydratase family protein n=1 Tax=Planobacterium oryzisoli TaxID=2771435 RepID=A0A930YU11_9FLAO|nr:NAD-dependent epimerase/dehydratase family protein [Planobacterium oryzisoli]MBF5026354.1 NAD-dependent epimerase/dehydratase family protein [Planobacterium oryzisoli]